MRADLVVGTYVCKTTWLKVENRYNNLSDVTDNNGKAENDFLNVELAEFGIETQMSLANNIRKTCHKWAINNLIKSKHNNFITLLIMNIGAKFSTHKEDSLTIHLYQFDKFYCPSIDDIDQVSTDIVTS